jgi:hypothetical protein
MLLAVACFALSALSPVLEGTVVDRRGHPIEDATVRVQAVDWKPGDRPLRGSTGRDGRFRITLPRSGTVHARVTAPRFAPLLKRDLAPGPKVRLTLQPGAVLDGIVRDAATRQPLAGAVVWAREDSLRFATALDPDPGQSVTSDAAGRFHFDNLATGPHRLTVEARGHVRGYRSDLDVRGDRPMPPVEIALAEGSTLSGLVRDEAGRAVEGAVVWVVAPERPQALGSAPPTGPDGAWQIGLPAGTYTVAAVHASFGAAVRNDVVLDGDGTAVDLHLAKPVTLTARLVDEEGAAVADGRVVLGEVEGVALPWPVASLLTTVSDAGGRFRLQHVPVGSLTLYVTADGFAERDVDAHVSSRSASPYDLGDVALDVGRAIHGRVVDAGGRGIAGASVTASARGGGRSFKTTSGDDGHFRMAGIDEATYRLSVNADGFASATATAEPGQVVTVAMMREAVVVARVLGPDGAAVPSCVVRGQRDTEGQGGGHGIARCEDGGFRLARLQEGAWSLHVAAPGFAPLALERVDVAEGTVKDLGTLRLTAGRALRGVVVDASGTAVVGATVEATIDGRSQPRPATTSPDGRFEIMGLTPGLWTASARHPSWADAFSPGIEVVADADPRPVRITVARGGRVEGTVRARTLRGAQVLAFGGGRFLRTWERAASVGPDGTFTVDRVPPGTAEVTLVLPGDGPESEGSSVRTRVIEVRDGEVTRVEFTVRDIYVRGRVTGPEGALAGATLLFYRTDVEGFFSLETDERTTGRNRARTAEDGTYVTILDEPGADYRVTVLGSGRRFRYEIGRVVVPAADEAVIDLAVPGVQVTGRVTEEGTGSAVAEAQLLLASGEQGPTGSPPSPASATSSTSGEFAVFVAPGTYRLIVDTPRHERHTQVVNVGEAGAHVDVVLSTGATLEGRVVGPSGAPVQDGFVRGHRNGARGDGLHTLVRPGGLFSVAGLTPGTYSISASGASAWAHVDGVAVPGDPITIALQPGGVVTLDVQCATAVPGPLFARIETIDSADVAGHALFFDLDGLRLQRVLPAGRLGLVVEGPCGRRRFTLDVPAGGRVTHVVELGALPN